MKLRRGRGFRRAVDLMAADLRRASESRGFAESRLLTHWPEIVGPELAAMARPVRVTFPRGGVGATLTVLTAGAQAPLLQMRLPALRDRVNAAYGYNAVARIVLTQTAPDMPAAAPRPARAAAPGMAEAPAPFAPAPAVAGRAEAMTASVDDPGLRAALERLGANIISKRPPEGPDGAGGRARQTDKHRRRP
jgi:hypothetical protein